nr:DUF397 domain-containing protein [Streptomyces cavernae]
MRLDGTEGRWRKSSHSAQGNCVEVAIGRDVAVRDSHDPDGSSLGFSAYAWSSFLLGLDGAEPSSSVGPGA